MAHPWDHSTEDKRPFLALFARAVIEWNTAEQAVYTLLGKTQAVAGPIHFAHWVVVWELGSRSVVYALKTLAHDFYEGGAGDHIHHAADYYDRLLLYRNYYVHSLNGVVSHGDGRIYGNLNATAAKGKIVHATDELTTEMLEQFLSQSKQLHEYANRLADVIAASRNGQDEPLPDKPALPAVLKKTQNTHRALRLQHQPSPE